METEDRFQCSCGLYWFMCFVWAILNVYDYICRYYISYIYIYLYSYANQADVSETILPRKVCHGRSNPTCNDTRFVCSPAMTVSFECSVIYIRVFVRVFLVYLLCAVFFGFPVMCITSVCIYLYIYIDLYIYILICLPLACGLVCFGAFCACTDRFTMDMYISYNSIYI